MSSNYSTDLVLIGGGIAGLWLLNTLRHQGYQAILLESSQLGGAQTIASQGIIHGGLKYALSGKLSGAAQSIASMPYRWRQSLASKMHPDLSSVKILSESYYMWSGSGVRSRLKSFLGSKSLSGRVEIVAQPDYPDLFKDAGKTGTLYRLPDFVLETRSLLGALTYAVNDRIFKIDANQLEFRLNKRGEIDSVGLAHGGQRMEIEARRFVFCAGGGNEKLIKLAALKGVMTQVRPLHMVYLARKNLPEAFVHCIGDSFSLTPRLTISSHRTEAEQVVWYLGGELAESGIDRNEETQIDTARRLLAGYFPALDLSGADWHSFLINRAEPRVGKQHRPDDAVVVAKNNVLVGWPTKLTLAPVMADKVLFELQETGVQASAQDDHTRLLKLLPQPDLASNFWEKIPC